MKIEPEEETLLAIITSVLGQELGEIKASNQTKYGTGKPISAFDDDFTKKIRSAIRAELARWPILISHHVTSRGG